jgi:hypothetical protein
MVYTSDEYRRLILDLNLAKTSADVVSCSLPFILQNPDNKIVIGVDNETNTYMSDALKIQSENSMVFVRSYYSRDPLYFVDQNLLNQTFLNGEVKFPIEYSIMIDTNFASYINKYMIRGNLGKDWKEIVNVIEHLLYFGLDFNYFFYIFENTKLILPIYEMYEQHNICVEKDEFWNKINSKQKENLISLNQFIKIDTQKYRDRGIIQSEISRDDAQKKAKNAIYNFYYGEHGSTYVSEIRRVFNDLKLILLKILNIQFSSKKSAKTKLLELMNFMHYDISTFFERETIIAFKYFENPSQVKFFDPINKPFTKDISELQGKINNLTWDLKIPRLMEAFLTQQWNGNHFIPYFLTFDKRLNYILDLYPVKGSVFDASTGNFTPIPEINSIGFLSAILESKDIEKFFSNEASNDRALRRISLNKNLKSELIEKELVKLYNVLRS